MQISGTPTFVVNDQMLRGYLPYAGMKDVVEQVRDGKLNSVANFKVLSLDDRDGVKMMLGDSTWVLVRTSGTENASSTERRF